MEVSALNSISMKIQSLKVRDTACTGGFVCDSRKSARMWTINMLSSSLTRTCHQSPHTDVRITAAGFGGLVEDGQVPVESDTAAKPPDGKNTWQITLSDADDSEDEVDVDGCCIVCEDLQKQGSCPTRSGESYVIIAFDTTESPMPDDTVLPPAAQRPHCRRLRHVDFSDDDDGASDEVHFHVGIDLQEMIGRKSQLTNVSPVFKAMFEGPLQEAGGVVTVPDIEPWAFRTLLRFVAAQDRRKASKFDRADDVWEVLKASDKYDVKTLTDTCFHFLSQQHPLRRRSDHLCCVLELAHRLNHTQHHQQALINVKQHAARVLKNPRALAELCPQCMLSIVTADDLKGVDEILVHDAVLNWARHAYVNQGNLFHPQGVQLSPSHDAGAVSPSWIELRSVAGDLVKHVRYLTINKHTLAGFRVGDPTSCLLTAEEMKTLLNGDASLFPDTVRVKRGRVKTKTIKKSKGDGEERITNMCMCKFSVLVTILVLFIFMVIYIPVYLEIHGSPDDNAMTMAPLVISPAFGELE